MEQQNYKNKIKFKNEKQIQLKKNNMTRKHFYQTDLLQKKQKRASWTKQAPQMEK